MNIKIVIAGKLASGKSSLAKAIAAHTSYPFVSFGKILSVYAQTHDMATGREDLQRLSQGLIDARGQVGFMGWCVAHSQFIQWDQPLILEGLRHVGVYHALSGMFPHHVLIFCDCDERTQIERIVARDGADRETAARIIAHETEREVAQLKELAHLVWQYPSDLQAFLAQLASRQ